MTKRNFILLSWIFTGISVASVAQVGIDEVDFDPAPRGDSGLRIMFYNVENLFDTFDDPAINDEEFTPEGEKSWSYYRYKEKLNDIAKTIIAVGGWEPPDFIGLCEIENFQVLLDLSTLTPLKKFGYQIIHENSRDRRGIDVAALYLPQKFTKLSHESIVISGDDSFATRDILHATMTFQNKDTLHFFINHWPSRFGGKAFSEYKRILVANTLKTKTDSLFSVNKNSKIILLGDFNDEPNDRSLSEILNANELKENALAGHLYNLSFQDYNSGKGTLVFKEIDYTWFLFDQIIVSGTMISGNGLLIKGRKSNIFKADWLLKTGRPFRTYQGPIYRGGFSDHLPIFIDLYHQK